MIEVVTYGALAFLLIANVMAVWAAWFFQDKALLTDVKQADIGTPLIALGFWLGSSIGSQRKTEIAAEK